MPDVSFLRDNHNAVLATLKRDGTPQLSPVTADLDDDGVVVISSRETAMKVRNVLRRPKAWLCAFPNRFYGEWIQVDGPVEVVHLPDAMDGLVEYYRRVSGEHPDWDDYRAAMVRDQRCLIRLTPERVGPTVAG
jgi:PPOX class probable F420-dependent enzyme